MNTVIVADPAWNFGDKLPGAGRGADKHYDTMSQLDIERFKIEGTLVRDMDCKDAMLVLWRVGSQVEEAYAVIRAWGFVPKSEIVWIKTPRGTEVDVHEDPSKLHMGMGHYVRNCHEVAIVATRGKLKVADKGVRSVFFAAVGEHSAKPDCFYDLVKRLGGAEDTNYIELFGRKPRFGWTVYGNEILGGKSVDGRVNLPESSPEALATVRLALIVERIEKDFADIEAEAAAHPALVLATIEHIHHQLSLSTEPHVDGHDNVEESDIRKWKWQQIECAMDRDDGGTVDGDLRREAGVMPPVGESIGNNSPVLGDAPPAQESAPRRRGRPAGVKNKPKAAKEAPPATEPFVPDTRTGTLFPPPATVPPAPEALEHVSVRVATMQRAVAANVMTQEELDAPKTEEEFDALWRTLCERSPDFFAGRKKARHLGENLSALAAALEKAGYPVGLIALAAMPAGVRKGAQDWLASISPAGCAACAEGAAVTEENGYRHTGGGPFCEGQEEALPLDVRKPPPESAEGEKRAKPRGGRWAGKGGREVIAQPAVPSGTETPGTEIVEGVSDDEI